MVKWVRAGWVRGMVVEGLPADGISAQTYVQFQMCKYLKDQLISPSM